MNIFNDLKQQYRVGDFTTKLIYWNVLLFLIMVAFNFLLEISDNYSTINYWVALPSSFNELASKPWTLITYFFFHNNLLHLVFNMLMLHFVSRLFATFFTQKQLLGVYVLSSIFSGLLFIIGYQYFPFLNGQTNWLIGASASIMALLIATTVYQPNYNLRLALLGNVKLWHLCGAILFITFVLNFSKSNIGSQISHLGGVIFGFTFIKLLQSGTDVTKGFNTFLDFSTNVFSTKKKTPFKKVHKNKQQQKQNATSARTVVKDKSQQQIDEILDKISRSGYDSLTKEEKEFLFKAGK